MIGKRLESDLSVQTLYYCPDGFCTDACSIVLSGQVFPIDCMDFVGKRKFRGEFSLNCKMNMILLTELFIILQDGVYHQTAA